MKQALALGLCLLLELPVAAATFRSVPKVTLGQKPVINTPLKITPAQNGILNPLAKTPTLNNGLPVLTPSVNPQVVVTPDVHVDVTAQPLFNNDPVKGVLGEAFENAAEAAIGTLDKLDFGDKKADEGGSLLPDLGPKKRKPSSDFASMFALARETMKNRDARAFLREAFKEELTMTEEQQKEYGLPERVKDMSESQFMLLLQHNEHAWPLLQDYLKAYTKAEKKDALEGDFDKEWKAKFKELLADPKIGEVFKKLNDPLTPMRLDTEDGKPGYANAEVYANHQRIENGKKLPAQDLKQVVIDFVAGAEKEVMFNFFDFDLMDAAEAMIAAAKRGVVITGGIDAHTIETRPEVKAVYEALNAQKGITIVAVDSVGLNHQKVVIRDFNDKKKAKALFSSGNLTQSCVGPEGDLEEIPEKDRPRDSVPNANHIMVLDSYLLAQVAANSLTKTLVYKLRGDDYPLDGAYKILGEDDQWIIISFSPKGGLGDINRDMTRRLLLETRGPVRLMQFAFSSEGVRDALIERAKLEKAEGNKFDYKSVGDTPFAMRPWSIFLDLAGWLMIEEGDKKEYLEAAESALKAVLGEEAFAAFQKNVRVGPRAYRNHVFRTVEDVAIQYGAKIHHKVMISGLYAIMGTSFNFSEAANSNQEQFLVVHDKAMVAAMNAVFDGLFDLADKSIIDEIARRNKLFLEKQDDPELEIGGQYDHVDKEASRSRKKGK